VTARCVPASGTADAMIRRVELVEVQASNEGPVAVISLPGGPLTARTVRELESALAGLGEDRAHRVVLLESRSPDFCTGPASDLDPVPDDDLPGRLEALRTPVVVALGGRCVSAGLELVLGADVRVAAPGCTFGLPDVGAGQFTRWGGIQRLTRAVGPGAANAVVLLGRELGTAEAHAIGLVHEVADDAGSRAREVAVELAGRSPLALEYAKEAIRRGAELPLHHALRLEADFNHLLQSSRDRAEGLSAFFEKREPRFEGR